jgi:hypothetical protein
MTKNVVHGTRAQDEFMLDWSDVTPCTECEDGGEGDEEGGGRGVAIAPQGSKNNKAQRDRVKPLWCRAGCCGAVERTETGGLRVERVCPACLLLHAKALQAARVGVSVEQLRGPVYADYKKIEDAPAGATLVQSTHDSVAHLAKALVCVVTRAEEAAGLMYDRREPFVVDGRMYWPPMRGHYFEVAGLGYAVHAWATAAGVTQRMRRLMRTVNARVGEEVIPAAEIAKLSSKSHRIAMATLLARKGVPMTEIVEMVSAARKLNTGCSKERRSAE